MFFHVFSTTLSNKKIHDLLNHHFPQNPAEFQVHPPLANASREANILINFLKKNSGRTDIAVILYFFAQRQKVTLPVLRYLHSFNKGEDSGKAFQLPVILFSNDYWYWNTHRYDTVMDLMFTPKNHYLVTFANNLSQLEDLHNLNYSENPIVENGRRFIFCNIWASYRESFLDINPAPIPKIAISGDITEIAYPERHQVASYSSSGVIVLKKIVNEGDNYLVRLHKYLCCFASPVHVISKTNVKNRCPDRVNTHLILQKYFEILAVGSLLLFPASEAEFLAPIGLISGKNCMSIDLSEADKPDNIQTRLEWILAEENREKVDSIRLAGQQHARDHLNSDQKFVEIMAKIRTIISF